MGVCLAEVENEGGVKGEGGYEKGVAGRQAGKQEDRESRNPV